MKKEKQSPAAQIAAINEMVREATEPAGDAQFAQELGALPGSSYLQPDTEPAGVNQAPEAQPAAGAEGHAYESYDRWKVVEDMYAAKVAGAYDSAGVEISDHIKFLTTNGRALNLSDSVFLRLSAFILALKRSLLDVQEEIADLNGWIEDFTIENKGRISEATYTDAKGAIKSQFSNPEMRDAEFLRFSKSKKDYQNDLENLRNLERLAARLKVLIENETRKHTDFRLIYGRETVVIANGPDGSPMTSELTATETEPAEGANENAG